MVQLMWPEKTNCKSRGWWKQALPEPETTGLGGRKRAIKFEEIEQEEPLHKRWKSSDLQTTNQGGIDSNNCLYNPPNQSGPLGLKLTNSRVLLELIQASISKAHIHRSKKDVKPSVEISTPSERLKASNFAGLRLKIGQWEYVSKYEGDLVAKCYFAKHKLVWEVLDGKLKNKIEIQWGDIVALKANCPDNGPSTLTVVLGRQPLFFRETNPQPRKHTVWLATTDFTGGAANTYRQHYLQCAQGVLNKHYERLIQADTRLNFLSQHVDPFLDLPFAAKDSIKHPNVLNANGSNQLEVSKAPMVSCEKNTSTLDLAHGDFLTKYGYVESSGLIGSNTLRLVNAPLPLRSIPMSDIVTHRSSYSGVNQSQPIRNVSDFLLHDTQLTTASDEKSLTSTVNAPCGLLQKSAECFDPDAGNYHLPWHDGNDHFNPYCNPKLENENRMSKEDQFTDLLLQLPKITSLPRLSFDASQDGDIMDI